MRIQLWQAALVALLAATPAAHSAPFRMTPMMARPMMASPMMMSPMMARPRMASPMMARPMRFNRTPGMNGRASILNSRAPFRQDFRFHERHDFRFHELHDFRFHDRP